MKILKIGARNESICAKISLPLKFLHYRLTTYHPLSYLLISNLECKLPPQNYCPSKHL